MTARKTTKSAAKKPAAKKTTARKAPAKKAAPKQPEAVSAGESKAKDPVDHTVTEDLAKTIHEDGKGFEDEPSIGEEARTDMAGRSYPPTGTESVNPDEPSPITPVIEAATADIDEKAKYDQPANIHAPSLRAPEEPRERTGTESTNPYEPSPVTPPVDRVRNLAGARVDAPKNPKPVEEWQVLVGSGQTYLTINGESYVLTGPALRQARLDFTAAATA